MAISVSGIAILVAVAWMLGATRSVSVEPDRAAERLRFDEPDFAVSEWFWGDDRKSAAALSADGEELAIIFALGDSLATRRLKSAKIKAATSGSVVIFKIGELSVGRFRLKAKDEAEAQAWLSKFGQGGV